MSEHPRQERQDKSSQLENPRQEQWCYQASMNIINIKHNHTIRSACASTTKATRRQNHRRHRQQDNDAMKLAWANVHYKNNNNTKSADACINGKSYDAMKSAWASTATRAILRQFHRTSFRNEMEFFFDPTCENPSSRRVPRWILRNTAVLEPSVFKRGNKSDPSIHYKSNDKTKSAHASTAEATMLWSQHEHQQQQEQ